MKTRQEIKLQAKTNMGKQRGTAILFILLIFVAGLVSGGLNRFVPFVGPLIGIVIECVLMVFFISVYGAYIAIYNDQPADLGKAISNCGVNFWRKLGGMWWMSLWTFLWMLLLIVPGIIKSYAYSMTPYILADCPNVTATQALKLSMRMTDGHKGKLFVMHLSFIAWMLLSAITLYILLIVHVGPYMQATMAGYYTELRAEALAKGIIKPEELGMATQEN